MMTRIQSTLSLLIVCLSAASQLGTAVAQQATEPGKQTVASLEIADGQKLEYLCYLPQEYQAEGEKKFPLLLFLHGRGESHGDIHLVAKWGPPQMAARGDHFPFIVVSPQCPAEDNWSSETQLSNLTNLLSQLQASYRVDPQRVYLTGLSMGGYGCWALAAKHPDKFAAVVPICGGGDVKHAEQLKELPIWTFHGDQDFVVPIKESDEMVEAIRAAGGTKIRYTTLEHVGHNSWSPTYAMPELYEWMLQQSRPGQDAGSQPNP